MASISVRDFSCLVNAEVELKKVNVIIGPQGSGKSVLTKLIYFFNDIIPQILICTEDGLSLGEFKKSVERSFTVWFPPQAWGEKRFHISFTDGKYSARILRRKISGKLSDEVTVKFSSWTDEIYRRSLSSFERRNEELGDIESSEDFGATSAIEIVSRIRSSIWSHIVRTSDTDTVRSQIFIPAGRAFFTSIGRMVAGLEQGVSLDPATLRFARLFANWRDRPTFIPRSLQEPDFQNRRRKVMIEFFGGVVQLKRDSEFIEMEDGRKVPFSSLSSGQQELLPIWFFLDHIMSVDERIRLRSPRRIKGPAEMIYIEEPEAHLFPQAQCHLLDVLISKVSSSASHRKLVITTHSPYIMSRLNVLLKAGRLSRRKKINTQIGNIVSRDSWLHLEDFTALKIDSGLVASIVDEDEELIDAAFLDEISDVISDDFEKLLELEELI